MKIFFFSGAPDQRLVASFVRFNTVPMSVLGKFRHSDKVEIIVHRYGTTKVVPLHPDILRIVLDSFL